jgi:hypothetical protein
MGFSKFSERNRVTEVAYEQIVILKIAARIEARTRRIMARDYGGRRAQSSCQPQVIEANYVQSRMPETSKSLRGQLLLDGGKLHGSFFHRGVVKTKSATPLWPICRHA